MDPFVLRSILTAVFEYGLAIYVYKKKGFSYQLAASLIALLATYQLGEFMYFITDLSIGVQIASFATTLLPPLGIMLLEKITGKNYYSKYFLALAAVFATYFLISTDTLAGVGKYYCFAKYSVAVANNNWALILFGCYYIFSLSIAMFWGTINLFDRKLRKKRKVLWLYLLTYTSFFPTSILIVKLCGGDLALLASIMCGLAVIAAMLIAYISIRYTELVTSK